MAPYPWKLKDKACGLVLGKYIKVTLEKVNLTETIDGKSYKAHVGTWKTPDGITFRHTFIPELYNDLLPCID